MKAVKGLLITLIVIVSLLILIITLIGMATFDPLTSPTDENDFSSVIKDNVDPNVRVVDIAMLGAHDVFSSQITNKSSWCPFDTSPFANDTLMSLASGLMARMAKAQYSDTYTLLNRGIRYLDVRLTIYNDTFYTQHGLINGPLEGYLIQVVNFLAANPGEFILFDIQHARLGDRTFAQLFEFMRSIRNDDGYSIDDFVLVIPYMTNLGELTLAQATQNGTKAGIVILAKTATTPTGFHFNYYDSIRSTWHNQIRTDALIENINDEHNLIYEQNLAMNKFRVNQAQTTPNFMSMAVFRSIFSWSLLNKAQSHNVTLLNYENFELWLTTMPIFMVDFSDSSYNNFNYEVMQRINAFNQTLKG